MILAVSFLYFVCFRLEFSVFLAEGETPQPPAGLCLFLHALKISVSPPSFPKVDILILLRLSLETGAGGGPEDNVRLSIIKPLCGGALCFQSVILDNTATL